MVVNKLEVLKLQYSGDDIIKKSADKTNLINSKITKDNINEFKTLNVKYVLDITANPDTNFVQYQIERNDKILEITKYINNKISKLDRKIQEYDNFINYINNLTTNYVKFMNNRKLAEYLFYCNLKKKYETDILGFNDLLSLTPEDFEATFGLCLKGLFNLPGYLDEVFTEDNLHHYKMNVNTVYIFFDYYFSQSKRLGTYIRKDQYKIITDILDENGKTQTRNFRQFIMERVKVHILLHY